MEKNKVITIADCQALYHRFQKYIETAEQHEFPRLMMLDMMFQRTVPLWKDPINQSEAQAMFRVVEQYIGKEEK